MLVGAQPDESTLIEAGQRGAHELVRVWYDAVPADESDTQLIAGLLACALRRLDVNLVLAGAWSGRRRRGVIGAAIAHALQLPHVSEVRAIRFDSDPRRVQLRQTRPVMEVSLILPMPAVLTVSSTSDTTPAANQEAPHSPAYSRGAAVRSRGDIPRGRRCATTDNETDAAAAQQG